jgi:hypothetical protein
VAEAFPHPDHTTPHANNQAPKPARDLEGNRGRRAEKRHWKTRTPYPHGTVPKRTARRPISYPNFNIYGKPSLYRNPMITEIADATGQLIHLVDDLLHQTQTRRLDAALNQATTDVQNFKDDLLAHRLESINLRLAGLQHGILVRLTVPESEQLHALQPGLDAYALLGLYARARAADLAAECAELLSLGNAASGTALPTSISADSPSSLTPPTAGAVHNRPSSTKLPSAGPSAQLPSAGAP